MRACIACLESRLKHMAKLVPTSADCAYFVQGLRVCRLMVASMAHTVESDVKDGTLAPYT